MNENRLPFNFFVLHSIHTHVLSMEHLFRIVVCVCSLIEKKTEKEFFFSSFLPGPCVLRFVLLTSSCWFQLARWFSEEARTWSQVLAQISTSIVISQHHREARLRLCVCVYVRSCCCCWEKGFSHSPCWTVGWWYQDELRWCRFYIQKFFVHGVFVYGHFHGTI